jgi:cyclic dehypoxanthinyl futalosine synthase
VSLSREAAWQAVAEGSRLTPEEGEALLGEPDLFRLGAAADRVRRRLHPEGYVTFIRDRIINYTNICVTGCSFCAFHRPPGHPESFVRSLDEIFRKIDEMEKVGGTTVFLQGGHNPDLGIDFYEHLFSAVKSRYPHLYLHSLAASEIDHIATTSGLSLAETLLRLQQAGLDSLPGGGAELLVDEIRRRVSPRKIPAERWLEIHQLAHSLGIESTATMVFGFGETPQQRIEHLERLRSLQDRTGGFRSFIHWSLSTRRTDLAATLPPAGVEYLRLLAVARLYLDNFRHLHSGWVTEGARMAQVALDFGADDLGSVLMEELVLAATGVHYRYHSEEFVRLIRGAGRIPAVRNSRYEILEVLE